MIDKNLIQKLDLFNSKYKCNICRKRLRYKAEEIIHSHVIHNQNIKINNCPFCEEVFKSSYMLRIHLMKIHLNEKPYHCRICCKQFFEFLHLKKHCKKHVKTKMPFNEMIYYENSKINFEKLKINPKKNLVQFFILTGQNIRTCTSCNINFISDSEYLIHIWIEHMKIDSMVCWQCKCKFSSIKALTIHFKNHLEEKIFKCSLCNTDQGSFFNTYEKAQDHCIKNHLQPKFNYTFKLICSICNQYIDESKIHLHYRKCSIRSNLDFSCTECDLKFNEENLYQLHKIQHKCYKEQMLNLNRNYLIDSIISPNYGSKSANSLKIDDIALKIFSMKQKKIDFEREEILVQYSPFLVHPNEKNALNNTKNLSTSEFPIDLTRYMIERKCLDDHLLKKDNLMKLSLSYLNQTISTNQCDFCGFIFKNIFDLNHHKKLHMTLNNKRPFRCHLCLVTFSKIDQLKRHMIVHQVKEQDSVCQICFSSFSRKQDLDRHLLFHSK